MSAELDKAKELLARGKQKKALSALWAVEPRARTNLDEAQGLVSVATALREHLTGRTLKECDGLLASGQAMVNRLAVDPRTGALVIVPECRYLGGSGFAIEPSETVRWDLIFHHEEVRIRHEDRVITIPYADLKALEVGEPAVADNVRAKTKDVAVRAGTTAAMGLVMWPVALPLLFLKSGHSTGVVLRTDSAELFLLQRSDTRPEEWRLRLSEVFMKLEDQPPSDVAPGTEQSRAGDDALSQLERLAKLREQGVISDEELQRLKAALVPNE